MPPLPVMFLQASQHLAKRQNGDSPDPVTLSITRATTTYTTVINLSPSTTLPNDAAAVTTVPAQSGQTIVPPAPINADPPGAGVIAGAVLGSILGVLFFLTILYKFCYNNESAISMPRRSRFNDYSNSDDSSTSSSNRVGRRGGGGEGFGRSNRRGEKIRRPARARTMRSGRRLSRSDYSRSGTRSDRSWSRRQRRGSTMITREGLWGWTWAGPTRQAYYTRRSEWPGTRRMHFTTDD